MFDSARKTMCGPIRMTKKNLDAQILRDLALAKEILRSEGLAFVLVKDGRVLGQGKKEGIGELLALVDSLGDEMASTSLADTIVGKAVAMIARYTGVAAIYASLLSEAAKGELEKGHILVAYDELAPLILDRAGDGPCPLERLVLPIEEPGPAVAALRTFVSSSATRGPQQKR